MKPRTHTCAATACQRLIPVNLLMCMDHWRRVPAPLQREVWRTFRRQDQVPAPEFLAARRDYLAAVQAAVDAVAGKALRRQAEENETAGNLFAEPACQLAEALPKQEHDNQQSAGQQQPEV